ncbi:MAG: hypothetical protein IJO33_02365 [Bacilli bacterium]|nr:hypothetical protein [Bacilli bacterium]
MRKICDNYDILFKEPSQINHMLLLHPLLIQDEMKKIARYSPFYVLEENGIKKDVLIFKSPMDTSEINEERKFYIPKNIPMLIGGLKGQYYIESSECGYKIVEKSTGKVLVMGYNLKYLGKAAALLDDFIITKNTIMLDNGQVIVEEAADCLIITSKLPRGYYNYVVYDSEGKCILITGDGSSYYPKDAIDQAMENAPKINMPKLPKNVTLYEQMIINCLKDKEELKECKAENLFDIVGYLSQNNIEIVLDLKTLSVYKVDYDRFFNKTKSQAKQGGLKLSRSLSNLKNKANFGKK